MNDELYQKLTTSRKYRWVCPSTVRRVLEECGVPSVIFDGDQTDPRLFSEAQYETRIQALAEMMAENKAKKGRAAQ